MPIHYFISADLDLTYARWSGSITLPEFRAMFASYLADQNYVLGRPELCDFSEFSDMDAGFNQIWSALNTVNSPEKLAQVHTRCVVYAPCDTAYGVARMYQSLAEYEGGIEVTVCREEAEALAILDLSFASIEEMRRAGNFKPPAPRISGDSPA